MNKTILKAACKALIVTATSVFLICEFANGKVTTLLKEQTENHKDILSKIKTLR